MSRTQQLAAAKASGKQVAMLCAIAKRAGLSQGKLLEWLEYESGLHLQLTNIEELGATFVTQVKERLEKLCG